MKIAALSDLAVGVGVIVAVVALVYFWRNPGALAKKAVEATGEAAAGAVKGASGVLGVPDTDAAKCADALARGDYWNASFYCPAGTFIRSVATGAVPSNPGTPPKAPPSNPTDAARSVAGVYNGPVQ